VVDLPHECGRRRCAVLHSEHSGCAYCDRHLDLCRAHLQNGGCPRLIDSAPGDHV
jgi:hypothetical protein